MKGDRFRQVIMTYPIFKTDGRIVVDFKNSVWERGKYSDRPIKLINVAGINHHSTWCGVSSTIKNYLGISDLSGGPDPHDDGKLTTGYYYRQRKPQESPYYQCVEDYFETFEQVYDDRFPRQYGFL